MGISYHIFTNDALGGPVDFTTVLATVTTPTYAPTLAPDGDYFFAVRPFDTVTGMEDPCMDCMVRIVIDADGEDVTGLPAAPFGVTARPAGDGVEVSWFHNPGAAWDGPATGFDIWATPGASVDYGATPDTELGLPSGPYKVGDPAFAAIVTGLADGTLYAIGVRAWNAKGVEANTTATVAFTADITPPTAATHATASPTFVPPLP